MELAPVEKGKCVAGLYGFVEPFTKLRNKNCAIYTNNTNQCLAHDKTAKTTRFPEFYKRLFKNLFIVSGTPPPIALAAVLNTF
jgi:hypothetical protein